jgi:hypothetical protein
VVHGRRAGEILSSRLVSNHTPNIDSRSLAPGVYELEKLAVDKNGLKAGMSHYRLDMQSADYPLRALVFGGESAKISGQVVVNKDGSKTFKGIEIKPFDTDFDFEHNTWDPLLKVLAKSAVENTILKNMVVDMKYSIVGAGVSMHRILIGELGEFAIPSPRRS